ncbi:ABC transporter substrate-binding protein [Streptomyces sp. NPDC093109]|uniref:ABC transporter substrate-binding protein n=1 Tax=Streptomyces sp. NPDC093109 TaxID=3154977 RepID=UPI00344C261D
MPFLTARLRRAGAVTVAAALASTLLVSCSSSGDGGGSGKGAGAGKPAEGGALKIAIDADPVCLDPQQATLIASAVIYRQLVDSLLDQDPRTGEFTGWLADTWKAAPDAKSFTFHLREGATFSDGSPVDAAAVKANFDAVVAAGAKSPFGAQYLLGYAGTDVKDARNLTVRFKEPNAQFLMAVASPTLGLLSPASLSTSLADRCTGKGLIGSGPFTFTAYAPNSSVTLTRRAEYAWPSELAEHSGAAHLSTVTYNVVTEPGVRSGSLKSRQVDIATTLLPQDEKPLEDAGFTLLSRVNPGIVIGAAPNLKRSGPLQDPTVRRAFQLAVDRKQIADSVLSPSYGVATSILGATTPGFTDTSALLATDTAEAKKLLDGAGWKTGSDGIRVKDGKKLAVSLLYFYQPNVIEAVQQQLRGAGIDLRLNQVTAAEYQALSPKGDYDLRSTSVSRPDPDILRSMFSTRATNLDWLTTGAPKAAELEKLYDQGRRTTDPAKRHELAAEAQKILIEQSYAFPFSQLTQVVGIADRVSGVRYDSASRILLYDAALAR